MLYNSYLSLLYIVIMPVLDHELATFRPTDELIYFVVFDA